MILLTLALAAAAPAESDKPTQQKFDLQVALQGSPAEKGKGDLYATIHTSMGDMVVKLFEKQAPGTVANFVGLARGTKEWRDPETNKWSKKPLYKGVICHRVIPNFMIQCGDPTGKGSGGPGYTFNDEFEPSLHHDKPGMLSMANRGPDTNGSQFFVTEAPAPHLDGHHAIFGEVVKNVELVTKITRVKTTNDRPDEPVVIKSIDIYRSEKQPK